MEHVRLYDLNKTLVSIKGYEEYVFGKNPVLKAPYELGDIHANLAFELSLGEGLEAGDVEVVALDGVGDRLAMDFEQGIGSAVFSTCLGMVVEAIFKQIGLTRYVADNHIYSTFDYNHPVLEEAMKTAATKMSAGFRAVNEDLGGRVISYVDDKPADLERAREGLGEGVKLYQVGGENSASDIRVVSSILEL